MKKNKKSNVILNMGNKKRMILTALLLMCFVFLLAGCSDVQDSSDELKGYQDDVMVAYNATATKKIENALLNYYVTNDGAYPKGEKEVVFKSLDDDGPGEILALEYKEKTGKSPSSVNDLGSFIEFDTEKFKVTDIDLNDYYFCYKGEFEGLAFSKKVYSNDEGVEYIGVHGADVAP